MSSNKRIFIINAVNILFIALAFVSKDHLYNNYIGNNSFINYAFILLTIRISIALTISTNLATLTDKYRRLNIRKYCIYNAILLPILALIFFLTRDFFLIIYIMLLFNAIVSAKFLYQIYN